MANQPRQGFEQVAGIPWLARMIDKARLTPDEKVELDLDYPCPMDQGLLSQLGLSGSEFQQIAVNAKTDDEIVEELKKRNALPV